MSLKLPQTDNRLFCVTIFYPSLIYFNISYFNISYFIFQYLKIQKFQISYFIFHISYFKFYISIIISHIQYFIFQYLKIQKFQISYFIFHISYFKFYISIFQYFIFHISYFNISYFIFHSVRHRNNKRVERSTANAVAIDWLTLTCWHCAAFPYYKLPHSNNQSVLCKLPFIFSRNNRLLASYRLLHRPTPCNGTTTAQRGAVCWWHQTSLLTVH